MWPYEPMLARGPAYFLQEMSLRTAALNIHYLKRVWELSKVSRVKQAADLPIGLPEHVCSTFFLML